MYFFALRGLGLCHWSNDNLSVTLKCYFSAFNTTKLIDGYQYEPLSQAAGGKFHSPPSSQCPLCVTLGHLLHPSGLTNAERRLPVPRVARYICETASFPCSLIVFFLLFKDFLFLCCLHTNILLNCKENHILTQYTGYFSGPWASSGFEYRKPEASSTRTSKKEHGHVCRVGKRQALTERLAPSFTSRRLKDKLGSFSRRFSENNS